MTGLGVTTPTSVAESAHDDRGRAEQPQRGEDVAAGHVPGIWVARLAALHPLDRLTPRHKPAVHPAPMLGALRLGLLAGRHGAAGCVAHGAAVAVRAHERGLSGR